MVLQMCNLNYTYGNDKKALSDVSLNINEGEKIAVLGSNGAGKSTFFLTMNGVLTPDSGKIYCMGNKITKKNLNQLRRNVGVVFQDPDSQIIASTVLAEVSFGPMNLRLPLEEVRRRTEEALAYMNISQFKDRPPHYLSGGEKKRVSIADIIVMKSEIIVFDEPTSSLDPFNTAILEEVLEKLSLENKAIVLSTHDVNFAYRWAERIIIFHEGSIIADGTPIEIFQNTDILKKANLSPPTLMEVYKILLETSLIKKENIYPKNIKEFKNMILSK